MFHDFSSNVNNSETALMFTTCHLLVKVDQWLIRRYSVIYLLNKQFSSDSHAHTPPSNPVLTDELKPRPLLCASYSLNVTSHMSVVQ